MPRVLVTGASRGLGLEFVRQYAEDGWQVLACCRSPDSAPDLDAIAQRFPGVSVARLDLDDHPTINELAAGTQGQPIDLLINNAGTMGAVPFAANLNRQHFGSVDYALWEAVFRTNTLGTVRVTEAFLEHVARSGQRKVVTLSSTTGSISESRREALAYTTSKTALNKATTLIADKVRPRGVTVTLLCPGYVKTRMNVGGATIEIPDSVAAMRSLIDRLTLADSGRFLRYNGETIGW
jgi:NAD(P)-dependent dehydrogenase (short-subunit alcohol dehydrogenase family)